MNVGLLSMQRVANYGSFWQAYCLKDMIQGSVPCQVDFIDIIPGELESRTEYKRTFRFSKIKRIPYYYFQRNKKDMFHEYQNKVLGCSESYNFGNNYDSIIIGSDEVFNFVQKSPWGFTSQLYGDIENNNVNTYAACFGYTTKDVIQRTGRVDKISKGLSNIRNLSVRDKNSADIVEALIGKKPIIHLDPVIVGDLPENLPIISEKKFILVYSYDFRLSDLNIVKEIRSFAKKKDLKIFSVGFYQDWVDKNVLTNPLELLSYFSNAEYVVTDTFHGMVFSTRMHRKFITVIRDTNKQKLGDLLVRIGMEARKYSEGDVLQEIIDPDIDYNVFESLRVKERSRTNAYLTRCLQIFE